jgi:hypothetical protein
MRRTACWCIGDKKCPHKLITIVFDDDQLEQVSDSPGACIDTRDVLVHWTCACVCCVDTGEWRCLHHSASRIAERVCSASFLQVVVACVQQLSTKKQRNFLRTTGALLTGQPSLTRKHREVYTASVRLKSRRESLTGSPVYQAGVP